VALFNPNVIRLWLSVALANDITWH